MGRGRPASAWVALALLLPACSRVTPCEPWKGWELTALSDAPGERLEVCTEAMLRWRVMPGGTPEAWLRQLEAMKPDGRWRAWQRRALVRSGTIGVSLDVRSDGDDLVITLRPDRRIDVAAALRELELQQ
ncbi:MAG: hypothetical protein Q8S33_06510 [Myxococcales bacterium]|nr:hypothetical protein [Myxococcales bacterium]